ncbi:hypothetical protein [Lichenihabitans psoromatis]|uniref:hypothetical protein n=1 Tax=Lichenihabitans psoromatis TaxID=2528642 RepID=UPI0010363824|nr:hypothetical protein [Lichenihabitans psoromatis]
MVDLYRDDDLLVRAACPFGSTVCFVTFDSYSDVGSLDRPAFGESFLRDRGFDAVHILSRRNNWYLHETSAKAFDAARNAVTGYRRVVTYGSSMGGYAAIRFGRQVGAGHAIAMSPQYSINPDTPPFETRWRFDAEAIDFRHENRWDDCFVEAATIFYDPRDPDRHHVEMFKGKTRVIAVPVVNGGHPCTTMLAEIGLLQTALPEIAAGTFDPAIFAQHLKAERRRSAHLYYNISNNIRRPRDRVRFARMAADLRPQYLPFLDHLGALLVQVGDLEEGKRILDHALVLEPDRQITLYRLSEYYEAAGDLDRAIAIMDRLVVGYPHLRNLGPRLNELLDIGVERLYERLFDDEPGPTAVLVGRGPSN